MALEVEGVVGRGVHRDELLGGSRRLEALHLTFASTKRLVEGFRQVSRQLAVGRVIGVEQPL